MFIKKLFYILLFSFTILLSVPSYAAPKKKRKSKKYRKLNKKKKKRRNKKKRRRKSKKRKDKKAKISKPSKDKTENKPSQDKDEIDKDIYDDSDEKKEDKDIKIKEQKSNINELDKNNKKEKNQKLKQKEDDQEIKEKENPKELYSYTWKSEKKKIFEKKEPEVHSDKTTKYATFGEIKDNIEIPYRNPTDLDVRYIHRWTLNERFGNRLQDLGVDGTPSRSIYFDMPEYIGTSSGHHNYDLYFKKPEDIKIYDTKSPYTYIFIIPGRKISKLIFEYSQNINENWNISGTFSNLSMASPFKLYPEQKYILSRMWDAHSHYQGFNNKYDLIVTISGMKHYCKEYSPNSNKDEELLLFDDSNEEKKFYQIYFPSINLEYPKNNKQKFLTGERGTNGKNKTSKFLLNVYNQYEILSDAYSYYQFGYLWDSNTLGERDGDELEDDHPKLTPFRSTVIHTINNEIGFKSKYGENIIYRVYIRRSDLFRKYYHLKYDIINKKLNDDNHLGENYIGGKSIYKLNENSNIDFELEYLIPKYYKTGIRYKDKTLELSLKHSHKKNPFISNYYEIYNMKDQENPSGNIKEFNSKTKGKNKINHPFAFATKGFAGYKVYEGDYLSITPNIMALSIGEKLSECDVFFCPGARANITFGNIHFDNDLIYSLHAVNFQNQETKTDKHNLPTFFINSSIYYLASFYRDKLKICSGFDINFKTAYQASKYDGYSKENPTYNFKTDEPYPEPKYGGKLSGGWPIINAFLNLMYQNFTLFFKITHLNYGLMGKGNYFATNSYPGQSRSYDLGIAWKFFN
ncbi:MAG: putative porin [Bacteroidetes bacterium]|nr:putative porin [Bacteroidota bacterium]